MADNLAVTPGSGAIVGADDIGGVLHQRVKLTWGADGTANDADTASGKPIPVQVRSATGLIPVGEPTDAKSTATDTTSVSMVSVLKQISASVQLMVFGAGTSAAAQRVVMASDDAIQGATNETAPVSDTAASGLNGRLQRIAQRITSLIALLPTALSSDGRLKVSAESGKASFGAYYNNIVVTANGVLLQIQGSGTKTVRVTRISTSGNLTTAAVGRIQVYKSSTAATGGSPVTKSGQSGKMDSNDAASTATLTVWSTSPSGSGSVIAGFRQTHMFVSTPTGQPEKLVFDFGTRGTKPPVLNGTSEYLIMAIESISSYTGADFVIDVEWTEE